MTASTFSSRIRSKIEDGYSADTIFAAAVALLDGDADRALTRLLDSFVDVPEDAEMWRAAAAEYARSSETRERLAAGLADDVDLEVENDPTIGSSSAAAIRENRREAEAARRPSFDVWYDGERTVEKIEADSIADAVSILVDRYGIQPGFSPLGRRDVTPAGGDWTDRASCSCDVSDPGDAENGPRLEIDEWNPECELHGSLPYPIGVESLLDNDELERRIAQIRRTLAPPFEPTDELRRLVAEDARRGLRRAGVSPIVDEEPTGSTLESVLRDALGLSPEDQRELVSRLFDSRAGL